MAEELNLGFEPDDIVMAKGAFGAIELAFSTFLNPGDDGVIQTPAWFF